MLENQKHVIISFSNKVVAFLNNKRTYIISEIDKT